MDETILELMENERETKVKKAPNSLEKHVGLGVYVLKKLFEYNYDFLGKDREKNHHQSIFDRIKLDFKNGTSSYRPPMLNKFYFSFQFFF